jgi:hypothetical protein
MGILNQLYYQLIKRQLRQDQQRLSVLLLDSKANTSFSLHRLPNIPYFGKQQYRPDWFSDRLISSVSASCGNSISIRTKKEESARADRVIDANKGYISKFGM